MTFDSVHNYYERYVYDEVLRATRSLAIAADANTLEDVACVALNRLPARYIRYDIDLAFYLTSAEREQMDQSIKDSVHFAIDFVQQRLRKPQ